MDKKRYIIEIKYAHDKKGENVGRFQPQGKNPYGQSQIKGKTFAYNK